MTTPQLTVPPRLVEPTAAVRDSYIAGEQADARTYGTSLEWVTDAIKDFEAYAAARRGVRTRWNVPSTMYWYVSGEHYLGTLMIRHELTPELAEVGGHIGYHVVVPWQRQGHATRMLAEALPICRDLGLDRVLLTCDHANEPSRRVILANGGIPDGHTGDEDRYWIPLPT